MRKYEVILMSIKKSVELDNLLNLFVFMAS